MKMLVCGKGGSGKSTLTALLAQHYGQKGKTVMVVDTDESNLGLHRFLGVNHPTDLMDQMGGKLELMGKMKSAMNSSEGMMNLKLFDQEWRLQDIPPACIAENGNVKLLSIGKIHHAGEGCACPMGFVAKQFLKNLKLSDNEMVIIDTEAGLEHFGRGIEEGADAVLMVLDPSYESVLLAQKAADMTASMNLPMYFVLNKVTPEISNQMRKDLPADKIIGEIPMNQNLLSAGLTGKDIASSAQSIMPIIQTIISGINGS
ncbi:MAG TPA: P-loop NTPase [Methanospirillum sp.]|uniref:ATP-binding protein n=1 Tax=Methanospirillum sp. TaxID=45200 RepID=UPI002C57C044|nr:P-loop NTPase [Methanospirillum sp.]HOJ97326.1 P-loop NTPase [Methanospirillum sp.]